MRYIDYHESTATITKRESCRVSSAMAKSTLSALPTELFVQIFESANDFTSAASLNETSVQFSSIYKGNLSSICSAIEPRLVECFDQARELHDAQRLVAPVSHQAKGMIIKDAKGYLDNLTTAEERLDHFVIEQQTWTIPNFEMTSSERTAFLEAWYRLEGYFVQLLHCYDIRSHSLYAQRSTPTNLNAVTAHVGAIVMSPLYNLAKNPRRKAG